MKLFILADDLTGALDTSCVLSELGYDVTVCRDVTVPLPDAEVVTCNADTRHLSPKEAYDRTRAILQKAAKEAEYIYVKVDSALRGNVSAAVRAGCDMVKGPAAFAPALPKAGRTTVGGVHYINGVPLAQSPYANDPLEPARESRVSRLVSRDFPCRMEGLAAPYTFSEAGKAAEVFLFDCEREDELAEIAAFLRKNGLGRLVFGSAGLIQDFARCFFENAPSKRPNPSLHGPALVLSGSLHAQTKEQIGLAAEHFPVCYIEPTRLLKSEDLRRETALSAGKRLSQGGNVLLSTAFQTAPAAVSAEESQAINGLFGELAREIMEEGRPGLLYLIGGDTTGAVLESLGITLLYPQTLWETGIPMARALWRGKEITVLTKSGGLGSMSNIEQILRQTERKRRV